MNKKINAIIAFYITCFGLSSMAQTPIKTDLSSRSHFHVINRDISISASDPEKIIVHLDEKPGGGVAWINNATFEKGIIEFDVKGKNIMQQSFVGIAFHALNDTTFDVVYFRPFNFLSPDPARKSHSVQYISLPQFDWPILREKYPAKYENSLTAMIEPEDWFHAKIVVDDNKISVFVNDEKQPSLVVNPLTNRSTGKIGFWVGNNSDGNFANLTINKIE